MSMECRSVERNVESTVATTPRLNLDWIASRTMTRLRQVLIPFPPGPWQESVLQHAAESTFMLTPDNNRGRLTEMPHGPGLASDFALELMILLLDEDGIVRTMVFTPNFSLLFLSNSLCQDYGFLTDFSLLFLSNSLHFR